MQPAPDKWIDRAPKAQAQAAPPEKWTQRVAPQPRQSNDNEARARVPYTEQKLPQRAPQPVQQQQAQQGRGNSR